MELFYFILSLVVLNILSAVTFILANLIVSQNFIFTATTLKGQTIL